MTQNEMDKKGRRRSRMREREDYRPRGGKNLGWKKRQGPRNRREERWRLTPLERKLKENKRNEDKKTRDEKKIYTKAKRRKERREYERI